MRLHLTVQRNALPPVRILWTTAALGPLYSAAGKELAISQFLEQVNDILPLESGEWGLEDYLVEVGGFECLHFLEARHVLKEGDEVCIRPLTTSDIRYRKVSGRHQISADGKHLIDGVAFGRPFLRRTARPPVRIPSRKRPRLTYDDEDDDSDYGSEAQQQIVVRPDFEDDKASATDSDYIGDEGIISEDEEDLANEANGIQNGVKPPNLDTGKGDSSLGRQQQKASGLGLRTLGVLPNENETLFPAEPSNRLDMIEGGDQIKETSSSVLTKRRRLNPSPKKAQSGRRKLTGEFRDHGANSKSVRFDGVELATPATVRLGSSDDSESDKASAASDSDESNKENVTSKSRRVIAVKELGEDSDSSSSGDSSSDASKTTSSESADSSSDNSESEDEQHGSRSPRKDEDLESTSSSGISSSSERSPRVEVDHLKKKTKTLSQAATETVLAGNREESCGDFQESRAPVAAGSGKKTTQKRNERRRDRKRLLRLIRAGTLPESATLADMRNLDAESRLQNQSEAPTDDLPSKSDVAGFEAKKQALLRAISSGGVDQEDDPKCQETYPKNHAQISYLESGATGRSGSKQALIGKSGSSASEKTLIDAELTCQTTLEKPSELPDHQMESSKVQKSTTIVNQASPQPLVLDRIDQAGSENQLAAQRPRTKLDRDSSRRLVFGALGLRTPKTKEDETRLREKLTRDAELARKPKPQADRLEDANHVELPPEEDDSWKDKIELSAVECCYDGIELSTPPFPFVQRWDPQQQKGYFASQSASRNKKKRKRNNKHYENFFEPLEDTRAPKRQQGASDSFKIHFETEHEAVAGLQHDDIHQTSDDNLQAANDQLLRETEGTYEHEVEEPEILSDLPQLPEDLSTCPDLEQKTCNAGAVVAFKQLHMSSETNWQPRISDYRAALIENILDDGMLSLRTASRDRPGGKRQYDSETGERLYSKFEMPGYQDDEIEGSNGLLELAFADLISPKLVRASSKEVSESEPTGKESLHVISDKNDNEPSGEGDLQLSGQDGSSDHPTSTSVNPPKDLHNSLAGAQVTEQMREEINDLIKDAGWRSSVQSNGSVQLEEAATTQEDSVPSNKDIHQDVRKSDMFSPQFTGFSSSPPAGNNQESEEQVLYPTIRGLSSPAAAGDGAADDPDQTAIDSSEQADSKAIQALREDFEREMSQPFIPSTPDQPTQSSQKLHSSIPPSESSQPKSPPPPATDSLKSTIPDSQPPKPDFTSPPPNGEANDDKDSGSDFPSLEKVFTSFSSQRNPIIKDEHHSSDEEGEEGTSILQSLPPHKAKVNAKNDHLTSNDDSSASKTSAKNNKTRIKDNIPSSSAPPSVPARASKSSKPTKAAKPPKPKSRLNRYEAAPRSSQDWIGTQVVDLTLSSDPVATTLEEEKLESGSEYVDSRGAGDILPKGPGWVKKNRVGKTRAR